VSAIDGCSADGDTGAALTLVIVKPAPIAMAATSESRTLRMEFSPWGLLSGEITAEQPGKFQKWLCFEQLR
jgi:hypothetical protein